MIPIDVFTTAHLPEAERYGAWLARDWPRVSPIYRTVPTEPFDVTMESAAIGDLLLVKTRITAMTWERRTADIRDSDFQPLIVNMMVRGRAQGDMDGRPFLEPSGAYHFHDLARPSLHGSSASLSYAIVVPRPLATAWLAPLESLHGLVVTGESAEAAMTLTASLWRQLPTLSPAIGARYARALLELLAAGAERARAETGRPADADEALRRAAVELIDLKLGLAHASARSLSQALGVTPERLAVVFRGEGGLSSYLLARRLDEARAALIGLDRAEPIGTIAHRLGFSDAAHLSRAFRRRFGLSPREYRLMDKADDAVV